MGTLTLEIYASSKFFLKCAQIAYSNQSFLPSPVKTDKQFGPFTLRYINFIYQISLNVCVCIHHSRIYWNEILLGYQ